MVKGTHGGRLSLEKFAAAKAPKWDKRDLLVRRNELKLRQLGKLKKVKKRMEADGRLAAPPPRDNVQVLELEEHAVRAGRQQSERAVGAAGGTKPGRTAGGAAGGTLPDRTREHHAGDAVASTSQPAAAALGRRGGSARHQAAHTHTPCDDSTPAARLQQQAAAVAEPSRAALGKRHQRAGGEPAEGQQSHQSAAQEGALIRRGKRHLLAEGTVAEGQQPEELQALPARQHARQFKQEGPAVEGQQQQQQASEEEAPRRATGSKKPHRVSQLERIAAGVQQKKAAEQAERDKVAKLRAEHRARVEAAERARRQTKAQYLKKTSRGQPLMSVRIDKILQHLQRTA